MEIIISVAIIATISAIGVVASGKYVDEAKITKAEAEVAVLEIAVSQYFIDNPSEKGTTESITALIPTLLEKGYLQKSPSYNGTDSCSYTYETVNGSTEKHVKLKGCTFFGDTYEFISVYGKGKK